MKLFLLQLFFLTQTVNLISQEKYFSVAEIRKLFIKEDEGIEVYRKLDKLFEISVQAKEKSYDFDSKAILLEVTIKNNFTKSIDISPFALTIINFSPDLGMSHGIPCYYENKEDYKPLPRIILKPGKSYTITINIAYWLKQYKKKIQEEKLELLRNINYNFLFTFSVSGELISSNKALVLYMK